MVIKRKKWRKIFAGACLGMVAMFCVSPIVQAGHTAYGSRMQVNGGYYSWTHASGYADNGVGYNLRAYAKIGDYANTGTGVGTAEAMAGRELTAKSAYHAYYVGGTLIRGWWQN